MANDDNLPRYRKADFWSIFQAIIVGLVVASTVGLATTVFNMRDAILKHNILIEQLIDFKLAGDRYTSKDGETESKARKTGDELLLLSIEKMTNNQVRYWKAMREHISIQQHSGAGFRMDRIEERHGDLKAFIYSCCDNIEESE